MRFSGFIWVDSGNEALKDIEFVPTIVMRQKIALKSTNHQKPPNSSVSQTAQLLHTCYGRDTDPELARIDAFYAFHEIFEFCAFSEVQFLNLMEKELDRYKLEKYTEHRRKSADGSGWSIASLNRYKMTIEKHVSQLELTLDVVKSKGDSHWPRAKRATIATTDMKRIKAAARQLQRDYEHLLSRAITLREKLKDSILESILESDKSQKVTAQTDRKEPGKKPGKELPTSMDPLPPSMDPRFEKMEERPKPSGLLKSLLPRKKPGKKPGKVLHTSMDPRFEKIKERAEPTRPLKSLLSRRRSTLPV